MDHPRRKPAIKANQIQAQAYSWKRVADKYMESFTLGEFENWIVRQPN